MRQRLTRKLWSTYKRSSVMMNEPPEGRKAACF